MGRVSRYKKIKSIDPFAKNGSWKSDVGDITTLRRIKRRSKTALQLKEQKASKSQRRLRGKTKAGEAGTKHSGAGGCNGWGDDDGYDLPPAGGDEFDMKDLLGSVKKETVKPPAFLDQKSEALDEKWTRKVGKVDVRGVGVANGGAQSSKNGKKEKTKKDGTLIITAKTPTKDIIAAAKSKKVPDNDASSAKHEKRKAFFEKKKMKKRKRGSSALDNDDGEDYAPQALQAQHSASSQHPAKKQLTKPQNCPPTLIARSVMGDQVERPPTFTSLPRGAHKLAKNQKAVRAKHSKQDLASARKEEGDGEKNERIRKEQQALEAMRERVMKQYAILRESRRTVGR